MLIRNRSYYLTSNSRSHFSVLDSRSYLYSFSRASSMSTLGYYEFQEVESLGGFVIFLTFTYCDAALPKCFGVPCLRNSDIRFLVHDSSLRKYLKSHGAKMSYLIVPEFGDGKGSRGLYNNPHYHGLFFVRPLTDRASMTLTDESLAIELRRIWNSRRFTGIVSRSSKGLRVTSQSAIGYVTNYLLKDNLLSSTLDNLLSRATASYLSTVSKSLDCLVSFYHKYSYLFSSYSHLCLLNAYDSLLSSVPADSPRLFDLPFDLSDVESLLSVSLYDFVNSHYSDLYKSFYKSFDAVGLSRALKRIKKDCFPRYLHSHHFGSSCVSSVYFNLAKNAFGVDVPTSKGVRYRPLPTSIFRSLFCDKIKLPTGVKYVLNDSYRSYISEYYPALLNSVKSRLSDVILSFSLASSSSDFLKKFRDFSDISVPDFSLLDGDSFLRLSQYFLIFDFRYFDPRDTDLLNCFDFPDILQLFSVNDYFMTNPDLSPSRYSRVFSSLVPYSSHPYFSDLREFISFFRVGLEFISLLIENDKSFFSDSFQSSKRTLSQFVSPSYEII